MRTNSRDSSSVVLLSSSITAITNGVIGVIWRVLLCRTFSQRRVEPRGLVQSHKQLKTDKQQKSEIPFGHTVKHGALREVIRFNPDAASSSHRTSEFQRSSSRLHAPPGDQRSCRPRALAGTLRHSSVKTWKWQLNIYSNSWNVHRHVFLVSAVNITVKYNRRHEVITIMY